MDKLKMSTPDLTDENIKRIAALFPNIVTETKDESGIIKKAVDFDLLKRVLSKDIVEGDDERYRLDWPGKKASLLKANMSITKTLRPCREESVNFDTTENLYIEGDNFEVLKILQESYLGKVKMIYIDPPYNTGNDFIYKDDFMQDKDEYAEEIGSIDAEGNKMFKENTKTNPRYHSDWLSMMHERLLVARDLLTDDGVLFISIDDNEVHNLRKICDETFGEENFVTEIIWHNNVKGRQMDIYIKNTYESCLVYSKRIENLKINTQKDQIETSVLEKDDISYYKKDYPLHNGTAEFHINNRPNLCYSIYYLPATQDVVVLDEKVKNGNEFVLSGPSKEGKELLKKGYKRIVPKYNETYKNQRVWRWGKEKFIAERKTELLFVEEQGGYYIYQKKRFHDGLHEKKYKNYINIDGGISKKELAGLLNMKIFENPKPMSLIKEFLKMTTIKDEVILDYFSGSATTAHAVMQLNAEDGGNRKFIMVQLPEKTDENSEAYKAGYKTIADIGKERIRRAGKKIVEELKAKNQQLELGQEPVDASKLDIGFRVYKTDESNMKDVFYHPAKLDQKQLAFVESNIKEDRTPEDLLTQVILDLGLELSLPIETKKIGKNTVFIVQANALVACFDNDIDFKIVDTIAGLKPFKVVFKDASFKDDKDRINVEERFKRLSPETKVTVI